MNVLVPFDFTAGARTLKHAVHAYSDVDGVTIHAVHFSDTKHETVDNVIKKEAQEFISEAHPDEPNTIHPDQLIVEVRAVSEETPEQISPAIEDYAREHDIDQIIMSEHERSFLARMMEKSNTQRLLESDVAPVTVVD